jgi:N6-adenosine-specific RNA methylase IME4
MTDRRGRNIALSAITVPPNRMRQLRPEKIGELAESIQARGGLLQPIIVRPWRQRYMLVAGWHRFEAVKRLGDDTIAAIVCDGLDADAALLAEIDENLTRADLSPAERALHLAERKRLYGKLYPDAPKHGGDRKSARFKDQVANIATRYSKGEAEAKGKSERAIQLDIARASKIPDLKNVVGTALDSGDQLDALAKLPEQSQRQLIARAKAGEDIDVKVAVMKARRCQREQELAEGTKSASEALGKKLYGVIYADPPWLYENKPMGDVARAVEEHYPTMSLDEIKAVPIPAAKDCVLFLWATVPLLPEALAVMTAWGFTYKSMITWVKDKWGIGYWVRSQCEHLLIGTRGNIPAPAPGDQLPAKIDAPRLGHSEKPAVFAEHIARLFPNVPKLEMFAREKRDGWDVWGNQVPKAEAAE